MGTAMALERPTATRARTEDDRSSVLLRNVTWEQYESFLEWLGDRSDVKVNFDSGSMEIMAPQIRHDRVKTNFGRLFEMMCLELDQRTYSGGGVTMKKRLAAKGLEPDECYWLVNEPRMRGKEDMDLDSDPPPDICIEIENTHSILGRLPIYAGIGVPELWRWHDERIEVLLLGDDGRYHPSESSRSFPGLPVDSFADFIRRRNVVDELSLVKEFVAWVRNGMPPLT